MMLAVDSGTPHLDDGELIRYADGELPQSEAARASTHLAGCARCAQQLEAVEQQALHFSRLLGEIEDTPVNDLRRARSLAAVERAAREAARPRTVWHTAPLRAAAAIAVLFATGLGASPVRAWVAEKWDRVVAPLFRDVSPEAEMAAEASPMNPLISFVPAKNVFTIELASAQEHGTVTLAIAETPRATAQIRGADGGESITVLPDGVRIENQPGSAAGYRIAVPSSLEFVIVRIADGPAVTIVVAERNLPWMKYFDLGEVGRGEQGLVFRQ